LATETQEKIIQKLEKLSRYNDRIATANVIVDLQEGGEPRVELQVAVRGAPDFVAQARGTNLLGAVEGAAQKVEQQLRRHKEKVIDQHRDPVRRRLVDTASETEIGRDGDSEAGDEE
jgi:putative sigma-54 modulation protein